MSPDISTLIQLSFWQEVGGIFCIQRGEALMKKVLSGGFLAGFGVFRCFGALIITDLPAI
jgi:hypothetical protein